MSERDRNEALGEGGEEEFAEGSSAQPVRPRTSASSTEHAPDAGWQGSTGATDFLGLDGDLRLEPTSTGSTVDSYPGLSGTGDAPVHDSWLMEIEGGQTAADEVDTATAQGTELEEEQLADGDELDPSAPPSVEAPGRSRTFAQLLAVVVVVALVGGGAWYWQQSQHTREAPVEVATRPTPKTTPNPKSTTPAPSKTPKTDPLAVKDPTATSTKTPTTTEPETTPGTDKAPTITMPDPNAHTATDPSGKATTPGHDTAPNDFTPGQLTITFPPASPPPTPHVEPPTAVVKVEPRKSVPTKGGTMPGTVRRATEADFADLWRETRIPTELFQNEHRIRTLDVGRVRALIIGGEYFEGTLYAVGQGRIWLDVDLGRISFEASTVRELTQLPPLPAATNLKAKKADDLAALPHVEVRLPGGSVTGRLVGQDGRRVTLITDDGLRTVIESDDVRPVTARNTRVLGTVKELDNKPH